MIYYNIDTTENGYNSLTGEVKSLAELKSILVKNDVIPDFVGYLSIGIPDTSICICAEKGLGFYVGITDSEDIHLSLGNKDLLSEVVDVWGDGLYISKGLFIPVHLACQKDCLYLFILHGKRLKNTSIFKNYVQRLIGLLLMTFPKKVTS